jgi:hypothetical protein
MSVIVQMIRYVAMLGGRRKRGVLASALVVAGVAIGCISTTLLKDAAAFDLRNGEKDRTIKLSPDKAKAELVGAYVVTGTDTDGNPYTGTSVLEISLAPSGALELNWDNGKVVGVGQAIDNGLSVALLVRGRTVISVMKINLDGSLSGTWLRRTDRGAKGTESWKKV